MRISDGTVEKLLTQSGRVSSEQIATLKEEGLKSNRPLQDLAVEDELFDEKTLTKLFAEYADIPYIELDPKDIPSDVLNKIPEHIARQYNVILFRMDKDGTQHLAMEDPDDVQALDFIEKQIGKVKSYIATHQSILAALEGYRGDVN